MEQIVEVDAALCEREFPCKSDFREQNENSRDQNGHGSFAC